MHSGYTPRTMFLALGIRVRTCMFVLYVSIIHKSHTHINMFVHAAKNLRFLRNDNQSITKPLLAKQKHPWFLCVYVCNRSTVLLF